MNKNLVEKLEALKSELMNSPEVKKLNELNERLNNNEEVMRLSYRKDVACNKYEDAIKYFGENSKEVNEAQKELYQAKLALDQNPLVVEYNNQFKIVRKIYDKINEEIFTPFNNI